MQSNLKLSISIERLINILTVVSILLLSVVVYIYQVVLIQPPCPLCLLQRIGYLSIALGCLLNLRFGLRSSHYALILISALFTTFVTLREIILQLEGAVRTSATLFGLRLSSWSFAVTLLLVIISILLLGFKHENQEKHPPQSYWKTITHSLFAILAIIIFANLVSAALQCGLGFCPHA